MHIQAIRHLGLVAALLVTTGPAFGRISNANVERVDAGQLRLTWTASGAVDVLAADRADAPIASAHMVSAADKDGIETISVDPVKRTYFLLRDKKDGTVTRLSERVLPLAQGSNFRDIGGYATADGKHVRWGMIYRSGASAMLSPADLGQIKALGLVNMLDLRSDEERQLAPTKIDGVPYSAVGYSMGTLLAGMGANGGTPQNGAALYHNLPAMLAPQMKLLFDILKRGDGPLQYNCSAGQDRTGFATALVLSALGVPRETIYRDYLLSTKYRQPKNEMPHIDVAKFPDNVAAQLFSRYQDNPAYMTPQPLQEADGTPFLKGAFDEIDAKWGSVNGYLEKELGVSRGDLALLKARYLE
ncbi:MAG: tyrosine-protein phosphatase [Sphingobium sp.]|nr:tyrosine-protein phosphatase [Sphingobium sp.]